MIDFFHRPYLIMLIFLNLLEHMRYVYNSCFVVIANSIVCVISGSIWIDFSLIMILYFPALLHIW